MTEQNLPELPYPSRPGEPGSPFPAIRNSYFSEEQMQAYARAAVELNRAGDTELIDFLADRNQWVANVQLPTECVESNFTDFRAAIRSAMRIYADTPAPDAAGGGK